MAACSKPDTVGFHAWVPRFDALPSMEIPNPAAIVLLEKNLPQKNLKNIYAKSLLI